MSELVRTLPTLPTLPALPTTDGREFRRGPTVAVVTIVGRNLRLTRRNVDAILTGLFLPVMIMLLFVYLFGGAIRTGQARYVTYVVPGVLLLCAGFGCAATAVTVSEDLTRGVIDRFRVMDLGGACLLTGQVVASVVRNTVSTVLVLAVALAIGFRPRADPVQWLAAAGVLASFLIAMSWFSAMFGVLARSPEAASGFSFFAMFLTYPSSAFVPIDTMPSWLQGFARHQPVTPVIETLRALLLDRPVGSEAVTAGCWTAGVTAVSVLGAALLFPRRTR